MSGTMHFMPGQFVDWFIETYEMTRAEMLAEGEPVCPATEIVMPCIKQLHAIGQDGMAALFAVSLCAAREGRELDAFQRLAEFPYALAGMRLFQADLNDKTREN